MKHLITLFLITLTTFFIAFPSDITSAQEKSTIKKVVPFPKATAGTPTEFLNIILNAKIFREEDEAQKQIKLYKNRYGKKTDKECTVIGLMIDSLGDLSIKENLILMKCGDNKELKSYAYIVFLVRAIGLKNIADTKKLIEYIRLYDESVRNEKKSNLTFWKTFMSVADDWLKGGCQGLKNLPPVIASASTFQRLADVSKADFILYHKYIKNRPDISGLSFSKQAIGEYMKGISDPLLKRAEHRRYSTLINRKPREHISSLFARNAYSGTILLKKRTFKGSIARANEHEIMTKTSASSTTKSNKWEDFKLEQFSLILEHFANRRLNTKSREGEAKHKLDAGDEFLIASIIYLFDNQPDKAYDMAIIAEGMSPKLKEKIKENFCDSLPNEDEIKAMSSQATQEKTIIENDPTSNNKANNASKKAMDMLGYELE